MPAIKSHTPERHSCRPPMGLSGLLGWLCIISFTGLIYYWIGTAVSKVNNPFAEVKNQIVSNVSGEFGK